MNKLDNILKYWGIVRLHGEQTTTFPTITVPDPSYLHCFYPQEAE